LPLLYSGVERRHSDALLTTYRSNLRIGGPALQFLQGGRADGGRGIAPKAADKTINNGESKCALVW
jgi:hypothetical protein